MPDAHSKLSASASDRWLACPGSIVLSAGLPDTSSEYADWGTAAHTVAEWTLREGTRAEEYRGRRVTIGMKTIEVSSEMVDVVQTYVDNVREMAAGASLVAYEQEVSYADALFRKEDDAWGTADTVAVVGGELQVHDLKTGYNAVEAEDNSQLMLYALGALAKFGPVADEEITHVRLVIHQPRVQKAPVEHRIAVTELEEFRRRAASGAASVSNAEALARMPGGVEATWLQSFTKPGDHCRYCKAKPTCPTVRNAIVTTVFGHEPASVEEFEDLSVPSAAHIKPADSAWLAAVYPKLDMIEDWCKSVLAEIERRLLAGESVPGTKIVQGRRGARAWTDKEAAEELLRKQFRLPIEDAYNMTVISPTDAEKLAKAGKIGERQWKKAAALIVQPDGKLHVAPVSDKRPAVDVKPVEDEFETVQAEPADFA